MVAAWCQHGQARRRAEKKGSALIRAAKGGHMAEAKQLLKRGADVNFQDLCGTPSKQLEDVLNVLT